MGKRLTNKDYIDRCKEKGYDLPIEPYKNARTKINFKCKQGHIYEQSPSKHLYSGRGCPQCYKGSHYLTLPKIIDICKEKGYDLPLDSQEYINSNTYLSFKCKQGHIYKQRVVKHLNGHGCYVCRGGISKVSQTYLQECKDRGIDLPIEVYKNNSTKIKHKCSAGHIYLQTPGSHLQGQGCPICFGNKKKTPKEYYDECKERELDLPIEDYVNAYTKIKHKCSKGHIYPQTPSSHLQGQGCPICKGTPKRTPKQYFIECKESKYDLPIEDYINSHTKIKHKCSKGHIYPQTPCNHLQGYGCPICNESHGEKFIRNYLDKNNIKYESQKRFHDLKDKTYLSYDFYLPKQNILIEYQGIQHYEECNYFGGDTTFKKQQYHDNLKREYAKNNGYKLLELHYSLDTQELVNKYLSRRIKG